MPVVLRGEKLIPRRDRAVDIANIDDAPVGRPLQRDRAGQVGERYERLTLSKDWKRPLGDAEYPQPRHGEASLEQLSARVSCGHVRALSS